MSCANISDGVWIAYGNGRTIGGLEGERGIQEVRVTYYWKIHCSKFPFQACLV